MSTVLAIDTSTEACSVALASPGEVRERHELLPRAHNRHVLAMVKQVLGEDPLSCVDTFACGIGPGSFTGLRIGVSASQGLAWSIDREVVPVCSLTAQAWSAIMSLSRASEIRWLLSTTDAQIGQIYWRWFRVEAGQLNPHGEPMISAPTDIAMPEDVEYFAVAGSGCRYSSEIKGNGRVRICLEDSRPRAGLIAEYVRDHGADAQSVTPGLLLPRYVQTDIGWKKLSEQPRRD